MAGRRLGVYVIVGPQVIDHMLSPSWSRRVLEPIDRVSEILFGLVMVLTFTGSLSVAGAGREDTRTMLIGALGCNLAWGIIDAVLFLMNDLANKGRLVLAVRAARRSASRGDAHRILAGLLPEPVASIVEPGDLAPIEERLRLMPEPALPQLDRDGWLGALGVFLLVFLSTFPVVIPFLLFASATRALRVSNLVAIVMLFVTGYVFAQLTGRSSWLWGASMVVIGASLAALTMLLGG